MMSPGTVSRCGLVGGGLEYDSTMLLFNYAAYGKIAENLCCITGNRATSQLHIFISSLVLDSSLNTVYAK